MKFSANLDVPDSDLRPQRLPLFSFCIKVSQAGDVKNQKIRDSFRKLRFAFLPNHFKRKLFKTDKYQMNRTNRAFFSATWKSLIFQGILMASTESNRAFHFFQIFQKRKFFKKFYCNFR